MSHADTSSIEELEGILREPIGSVVHRERNTLDQLLSAHQRRVVLFGAGGLGKQTLHCLRSVGVHPLAVSDNNSTLWGSELDGVPILAPQETAKRFGKDALFIVTIWNPRHWYAEAYEMLSEPGCTQVTPASPVYWKFPEIFLPFYAQDLPHKVWESSTDVLRAGTIWADSCSMKQYFQQVRWRTHGDWGYFRREQQESYFPDDILGLVPEEVFVDCGAFDGDTMGAFLARCGGTFRQFVAIEPDELTFAKLQEFVSGLAPDLRRKITVRHCAVGAVRSAVAFQNSGGVGSHVGGSSDCLVDCFPIDALVDESMRTTFIKMDIEGAEFDALTGARAVIERDQPVLAVCVYHKQDDLWRLPLLIKEMVPGYRMYLKCHEGDGWQTVAYAIPPDRVILE